MYTKLYKYRVNPCTGEGYQQSVDMKSIIDMMMMSKSFMYPTQKWDLGSLCWYYQLYLIAVVAERFEIQF